MMSKISAALILLVIVGPTAAAAVDKAPELPDGLSGLVYVEGEEDRIGCFLIGDDLCLALAAYAANFCQNVPPNMRAWCLLAFLLLL